MVGPPQAPPSTPVGCRQRIVSLELCRQLRRTRFIHWLSASTEALLAAETRSGRELAVAIIHRVPAGLDAAHFGSVFVDVVGTGHCGSCSCRIEHAFNGSLLSIGGMRASSARRHIWTRVLKGPAPNANNLEFCCACRWHWCCCLFRTETSVRPRFMGTIEQDTACH